jgi:hypothetical protein
MISYHRLYPALWRFSDRVQYHPIQSLGGTRNVLEEHVNGRKWQSRSILEMVLGTSLKNFKKHMAGIPQGSGSTGLGIFCRYISIADFGRQA